MYSITFRLIFVRMKATHTVTGDTREDCIAKIEQGFDNCLADSWEIISEGEIA